MEGLLFFYPQFQSSVYSTSFLESRIVHNFGLPQTRINPGFSASPTIQKRLRTDHHCSRTLQIGAYHPDDPLPPVDAAEQIGGRTCPSHRGGQRHDSPLCVLRKVRHRRAALSYPMSNLYEKQKSVWRDPKGPLQTLSISHRFARFLLSPIRFTTAWKITSVNGRPPFEGCKSRFPPQ